MTTERDERPPGLGADDGDARAVANAAQTHQTGWPARVRRVPTSGTAATRKNARSSAPASGPTTRCRSVDERGDDPAAGGEHARQDVDPRRPARRQRARQAVGEHQQDDHELGVPRDDGQPRRARGGGAQAASRRTAAKHAGRHGRGQQPVPVQRTLGAPDRPGHHQHQRPATRWPTARAGRGSPRRPRCRSPRAPPTPAGPRAPVRTAAAASPPARCAATPRRPAPPAAATSSGSRKASRPRGRVTGSGSGSGRDG